MQTIKEMFCNILKCSFRFFRVSNIGLVLSISCTLIIYIAPMCPLHAIPGLIAHHGHNTKTNSIFIIFISMAAMSCSEQL